MSMYIFHHSYGTVKRRPHPLACTRNNADCPLGVLCVSALWSPANGQWRTRPSGVSYRESKTKWEPRPEPVSRGGERGRGRAEQSRPGRARRQALFDHRSRTVLVLQASTHHSTTTPPLLPAPRTPSPSVIHVLYYHPTASSSRRHLPSAFPWRRTLLFVLPSCTTHPRRQPIPERRFVQPLLQPIIVTASGQSPRPGRRPLPAESAETHLQRRLQSAGPRELDLPGLVHGNALCLLCSLPIIDTAPHTISATRRL
jgi:hypothetical protein